MGGPPMPLESWPLQPMPLCQVGPDRPLAYHPLGPTGHRMTAMNDLPLTGRTVAIPETRQLDALATLLEERGAAVVRCPLVSILDAPDAGPVEAWLRDFCAGTFHDLILLTGEGLRRLLGFADRAAIREPFVAALTATRRITRGPKPARVLTDLGLRPDLSAADPTTDGVIATLSRPDLSPPLAGRTVGVQLYGSEPNEKLIDFLRSAGAEPPPGQPLRLRPGQ